METTVYSCQGMYGSTDTTGGGNSWIEVEVQQTTGNLTLAVFEFADLEKIADAKDDNSQTESTLLKQNIDALDATFPVRLRYPVTSTGYYCVYVSPTTGRTENYMVVAERRNPYGELPAHEYPKLPFYGVISIFYLSLGILWMFKCSLYWRDILPVQHYISGVILVLMTEMSLSYGYWSDFNSRGQRSSALLALVVLLNSARTTISLFVLLIVALGYGVVKPTLGSTMRKCLALTYCHFLFNVLYSGGAMAIQPESAGLSVLLFVLPLSVTMSIFYTWTLHALQATMQHLEARKQAVKQLMYQRLWRLLAFSLLLVFLFFVVNTIHFSQRYDVAWDSNTWKYRWFLIDGWMNMLFLVVFVTICCLWRPTSNNVRYGLEELSTSDDNDRERGNVYSTGTEGYNITMREQRLHSTAAGSDPNMNETAASYGGRGGPMGTGGAEAGRGPLGLDSNDSIFDIGDEGDDWLDDDNLGAGDHRAHHEAGSGQSRSSQSRSRSPQRSHEAERDRLTKGDSKMR